MANLNICDKCGSPLTAEGTPLSNGRADRVEICGMFENGSRIEFEGHTVEWVIEEWRRQLSLPHSKGPTALCPAIVYSGKTILREVGEMQYSAYPMAVQSYRWALETDPDIPRLLMEQYFTSDEEVKQKSVKYYKALGIPLTTRKKS